MVPAKNADKVRARRPSASQQMKRLLYVLAATQAPVSKGQVIKKPNYLRYIEYV
jgi:hypothetical protein